MQVKLQRKVLHSSYLSIFFLVYMGHRLISWLDNRSTGIRDKILLLACRSKTNGMELTIAITRPEMVPGEKYEVWLDQKVRFQPLPILLWCLSKIELVPDPAMPAQDTLTTFQKHAISDRQGRQWEPSLLGFGATDSSGRSVSLPSYIIWTCEQTWPSLPGLDGSPLCLSDLFSAEHLGDLMKFSPRSHGFSNLEVTAWVLHSIIVSKWGNYYGLIFQRP